MCLVKENPDRKKLICIEMQLTGFSFDKHCVKSVRIRSFSGPYCPAFGLTTERYSVSLSIQSKCGKRWTRKTPNTDTFYVVINLRPISGQCYSHIETSQLTCIEMQLTGFYTSVTLDWSGLITFLRFEDLLLCSYPITTQCCLPNLKVFSCFQGYLDKQHRGEMS